MRVEDIARALKISENTLRLHFGEEVATGKAAKHAKVIGHLFRQIEKGGAAQTIFFLKTQLGWKETQRIEHAGLTLAELVEGSYEGQK